MGWRRHGFVPRAYRDSKETSLDSGGVLVGIAAVVSLSRFNYICGKTKVGGRILTDTVEDLATLRSNGFTAIHLAHVGGSSCLGNAVLLIWTFLAVLPVLANAVLLAVQFFSPTKNSCQQDVLTKMEWNIKS